MRKKNILRISIVTGFILLVPLILTIRDGRVEGVGWNWMLGDFIVMGSLIFGTGVVIDLALRKLTNSLHKIIAVAGIIGVLFLIWVELAVDAVSKFIHFLRPF